VASFSEGISRSEAQSLVDLTCSLVFRPFHFLISAPSGLFLCALAAMLLRPPNLEFYFLDRIALAMLVFAVLLRALLLRQGVWNSGSLAWPLLAMLLLAFASLVSQPYDPASWSLFAAKWLVPFLLYHAAGIVFADRTSLRRLELFAIITFGYLLFIAIAFLLGVRELIFPSFILDASLGIHADRARGPFLQAVANGVSLNLLGLLALNSYRGGRLRGILALVLMVAFPVAILATKTRAVWLSSAACLVWLLVSTRDPRVRRAVKAMAVIVSVGVLIVCLANTDGCLTTRLEDQSPLDYRAAVYQAGWQMFLEKPILGWPSAQIQSQLASRITDFHVDNYILHNTYLEIAVNYGLLGLGLYLWMMLQMFRLSRAPRLLLQVDGFADREFRSLWPLFVFVFALNASFVVMNYQFVSGLLFTLAGILEAQNRQHSLA
jgi:putative inorganic carbon (HCO3(-)) transporter